MRKTVLFAAALFATGAFAQTGEITSAKGENYLSQDGDWGLTIDAYPFLNYAGNLFNGTTNNQPPTWNSLRTWDPYGLGYSGPTISNPISGDGAAWSGGNSPFTGTNAIIGVKKLVDANTAYRGLIRLGFFSNKATTLVSDAGTTTDPYDVVENEEKWNGMAINLGVGLEKRVGSTRVVGIYGAMFDIGIASLKAAFTPGNDIDATGSYISEVKFGGAFRVGLAAFAGVEWFAAPKFSLSGEFGWGLAMESKGFDDYSYERAAGDDRPTSAEGGTKTNGFAIDTNYNGVSIGANFYFQ
jgi:hypothetical protein